MSKGGSSITRVEEKSGPGAVGRRRFVRSLRESEVGAGGAIRWELEHMNRGASGSGFVAVGVLGGVRWQVPNDPFCYRGDGGRTAGGGGGAVECCPLRRGRERGGWRVLKKWWGFGIRQAGR